MGQTDWQAVRDAMMLDPTVTMLNTGSWGPLSRPVFERVTELRQRMAAGPTDFFVRQVSPLLWQARVRLAEFLHTEPNRLMFCENVTAAANQIASGLRLAAPGEILLTDHEYMSLHWCWERAARRQGLTFRTFSLPTMADDPAEIVGAFRRELRPETRLLFFSHVLSPTGLILPAREICQAARERGVITAVDGAHAPVIVDLNVDDIGADFYAGNCHKWMLAPCGAGFLAMRPGFAERLAPLVVSWGWPIDRRRPDDADEYGSTPHLRHQEFVGTRDVCPWLTVPAAIDFLAGFGWGAIRGRMRELAAHVRAVVGGITGLRLATPEALSGPMVAYRMPPGWDALRLRRKLWEARIEINPIERPDGLLLRVSTHCYNTEQEVDRLAEVMRGFLA